MEFLPILPTVGRALVVISSWYELYRVIGMVVQGVYNSKHSRERRARDTICLHLRSGKN